MRVAQDSSVVNAASLGEHREGEDRAADTTPLSETDLEVLRLAAMEPVGPSAIARALGIAKSSAADRLKRLERMGLLVKQGSSYRRPQLYAGGRAASPLGEHQEE